MENFKIKNVGDLLRALELTAKHFEGAVAYWRGHGEIDWKLLASAHRIDLERYEQNIAGQFYRQAKIRHASCPDDGDTASWVFLMQHYGLPTRLIDWSESVFIGAYFAVCDPKKKDETGALWALSPGRLNKNQIGREMMLGPENPSVIELFSAVIDGEKEGADDKTIAITTRHVDIRMMVQHSHFTIQRGRTPIEEIQGNEEFLIKFEVPKEYKKRLALELDGLKFSRAHLFPDLANLAKDVKTQAFRTPTILKAMSHLFKK